LRNKHTTGDDQLPQDSANVTKGSDHSKPNMPLAFISSFFAAFRQVCCRSKDENQEMNCNLQSITRTSKNKKNKKRSCLAQADSRL